MRPCTMLYLCCSARPEVVMKVGCLSGCLLQCTSHHCIRACKVHVSCFQAETEIHEPAWCAQEWFTEHRLHNYTMCHSASKTATMSVDRADISARHNTMMQTCLLNNSMPQAKTNWKCTALQLWRNYTLSFVAALQGDILASLMSQ